MSGWSRWRGPEGLEDEVVQKRKERMDIMSVWTWRDEYTATICMEKRGVKNVIPRNGECMDGINVCEAMP